MSSSHSKPPHESAPHPLEMPEPFGEKEVSQELAPYVMRFLAVGLTLILLALLYADVIDQDTPFTAAFWDAIKVFNDLLEAWAI